MKLPVFFFSAVLLCNFVTMSAWAYDMDIKFSYHVQWGKVKIADAEVRWVFSDNSYRMSGISRTVGMTKKFRDFTGISSLSGSLVNGNYKPIDLQIIGIFETKTRQAKTHWDQTNSAIKTLRKPEIDEKKVFPLHKKLIEGSIDPFSAILNAIKTIKQTDQCGGNYRVYDGLRTAILSFHPFGEQHLIKDRPYAFKGDAIKCGVTSRPTGGHRIKNRLRKKNRKKNDVFAFIAEVQPGLFIPVRIEVATPLGEIVARLNMPSLIVTAM